jgi:hypothetical protein
MAVVGGVVATAFLAVIPFRWTMTILIVASGFTAVDIGGLPVHLRSDIILVPAALLCCSWNNRFTVFLRWLRHPVILLLGAYVADQFVVSAFLSPDPGKSLSVSTWLLLNLLIVALALACFAEDRGALMSRLALTAALVITSGLIGWIYVRYLGGSFGAVYDPAFGLRAYGVAFEPNILAATAAVWVVIVLTKGVRLRAREWLFVILAIAVIPITTTRAGPIAILAGLVVYGFGGIGKIPRIVISGVAVVATAVIVQMVAPNSVATIVAKMANFTDQTASHRTASWQIALLDMHWWNWLIGMGTNSFGQRHIDPTLIDQQVPAYLGNLPLQTFYDSGVLGLALLVGAGWRLIRAGNLVRRSAVMAAFLVLSSATSPFFFGNWWLLIALGLARPSKGYLSLPTEMHTRPGRGLPTSSGGTRGRALEPSHR